jgi:hypothetical protein
MYLFPLEDSLETKAKMLDRYDSSTLYIQVAIPILQFISPVPYFSRHQFDRQSVKINDDATDWKHPATSSVSNRRRP